MKELLRTTNPAVIAFTRTLLEAEGIPVFALDVHTSGLIGAGPVVPCRLMVAERDHFMASAILRDNGVELVK